MALWSLAIAVGILSGCGDRAIPVDETRLDEIGGDACFPLHISEINTTYYDEVILRDRKSGATHRVRISVSLGGAYTSVLSAYTLVTFQDSPPASFTRLMGTKTGQMACRDLSANWQYEGASASVLATYYATDATKGFRDGKVAMSAGGHTLKGTWSSSQPRR